MQCIQGIVFKDMFPVFRDPLAVEALITNFVYHITSTQTEKIDVVAGKRIFYFYFYLQSAFDIITLEPDLWCGYEM